MFPFLQRTPAAVFVIVALFLLFTTQSSTGRLEIIVRDAKTREGLPGVPVTVTFKYPTEPAGPSTTLVTDPRGIAVFSALGTGNYLMKLGEGYKPLPYTEYTFIDPGKEKRIEISVNRTASVSVRILDSSGVPVKDALVSLPALTYEEGRRTLREIPMMLHEHDGDGVFRVTNVPAGEYFMQIQKIRTQTESAADAFPLVLYYPGITNFASAARITVRGLDLAMGEIRLPSLKGYKVSGTILNPRSGAGPPRLGPPRLYVARDEPGAIAEPAPAYRPQYSASSGTSEISFEISGLLSGTYALYLTFSPETSANTSKTIVTVPDQDVEGVKIVAGAGISLSARIIADGVPTNGLGEAQIYLRSKEHFPSRLPEGLLSLPAGQPQNRSTLSAPRPDLQTGELNLPRLVENVRYDLIVTGWRFEHPQ
jgi:hypothetical protein